ncbi:trypsin-like serine protease [Archangium violaceum]|uniref:S1 family peptidase n=1 Tax=Archangium violaceum TaxID=83451 RepID=UPI002B29317E|nr:trypsin-like serine protease [Archangium violaceum]
MKKCSIVLASLLLGGSTGCSDIPSTNPVLQRRSQAIKDGRPATADRLFGTVAVLDNDGVQECSGVLISPTTVVTAAHCVVLQDGATGQIAAELGPANLQVLAGALDVRDATPEQLFRIRKVIRHPRFPVPGTFNAGDLDRAEDIALLLLETPVQTVPVVPLLPPEALDVLLHPGTPVVIAGYGARDERGRFSGTLYFAETPFQQRNATEFSAGAPGSPDSCSGDSGGPALLMIDGVPHLLGLSARALHSPSGADCGDGGIYTLVPAYHRWLEENSGSAEGVEQDPGGCAVSGPGRPSDGQGLALVGVWMVSTFVAFWRRPGRQNTQGRARDHCGVRAG